MFCRDCCYGKALIEGFAAQYLLGDKAYDINESLVYAAEYGIKVVIPPSKNRIGQREYAEHIYKHRHLVENAFMFLKKWRGIAFIFAKRTASFQAALQIRFMMMWLKIL